MKREGRELYRSSNGDLWSLTREPRTGRVVVRHEANQASGGHREDMDLATFLTGPSDAPQRAALLSLIDRLIDAGAAETPYPDPDALSVEDLNSSNDE
jgi:hypothetical protein